MNGERKILEVHFENGEIWHIDAHIVAHTYAQYHAARDDKKGYIKDYDSAYKSEYTFIMNRPDELVDYAQFNMNWSDFEGYASHINNPDKIKYQKAWRNALVIATKFKG